MRQHLTFGLVLSLCAPLACLSSTSERSGGADDDPAALTHRAEQVQMNDVSVLYPLARNSRELDGYLSAADVGASGPLLPAKLYTDATGQPKHAPDGRLEPGADRGLPYDDLKVVAFRVDPCFAQTGPITRPEDCRNQLRLILQPVKVGAAVDGAVHAFFSLTRDELVGLVKDIVAIRRRETTRSSLGPLAVHPVIENQGLLGSFAKSLNELVLKHAGKDKLTRFTIFVPGNLATKWSFSGFDIKHDGFEPMIIPTLPSHSTTVDFFVGFGADFAGGFTPATNSDDDMQLLGNLEHARAATKAKQQAAFDAALRIQNPTKHSPETIDCASCHVAGPGAALTGGKLGLSAADNENVFVADSRFVSAADMKQTTVVNTDTQHNFHAFSYRDAFPMISQRVINETASVVAYLNGTVLKGTNR